jgi:hypothetical protein
MINGFMDVVADVTLFVRGDTNGDRDVDVSDVQATLSYLFMGEVEPYCLDAADANDDGLLNVADPVATLNGLFQGGAPLPPPNDDRLRRANWPGNGRELRNVVPRLRGETSTSGAFAASILAAESLPDLRARLEREYILHHLGRLGGNTEALSRLLGISRQQLYRRCRKLGIPLRDQRRQRS